MALRNWVYQQVILLIIVKTSSLIKKILCQHSTANYPLDVVKQLPNDIENGIYFGWANIDNGDVHKMVMSIGWNPFFDNKEKSMVSWI